MKGRDEVRLECLDLLFDESRRIVCPFCNGGSSRERCLSVKRVEAGLLYNCKRASCGKSGIVGSVGQPLADSAKRESKTRCYRGALEDLPAELWERCFEEYGIEYETCVAEGIRYAVDLDRIYFPVYDYRHYQIGEVLRAVDGSAPKVLTNKFSIDVPFLHFPISSAPLEDLTLVEDMISAIKVSMVTPACALLGTHLSDSGVEQLRSIGIKHITIMLDGDAAGLSASTRLYYQLAPFFKTRLVLPKKNTDPKDLSCNYLDSLLK